MPYGDLKAPPTDPIGPAVSIAGVASFGTLSGSPTGRLNKMYQVVDNLAHQAGRHALKAGVDLLFNDDTIAFPRSNRGAYTFSSLPNFLSGTYNNAGFTQTFGTTSVSQRNPNVGLYAQDEWKVTRGVTLNAGLRYDLQFLQTITTDTNNLSPRIGVAWTPSGSNRTIVRGSAGIFYDRVPLRAVANALLSAGNTTDLSQLRQINVSLSPAQAEAPPFPRILTAPIPLVTLVNLTTMDRHLQNAYSRQASVEVERQLGDRSTVSVGYRYTRGLHLIMSVNQNVPGCVAAGTNNGCRPNPTYANNGQYSAAGHSNYHGLHLSFVQRPARWGNYRLSYTLSKSMNDVGENFFSSPIDPFDVSKDWGRSDDDQRHRLVASGAVQSSTEPGVTAWERLTHGLQLSGMLQSVLGAAVQHHVWRDDDSGNAGASHRQRGVHSAKRRDRERLLQPQRAPQPHVPNRPAHRPRRAHRRLQRDESDEQCDAQHELRTRKLSDGAVALVRTSHGGLRSQDAATRDPTDVLR